MYLLVEYRNIHQLNEAVYIYDVDRRVFESILKYKVLFIRSITYIYIYHAFPNVGQLAQDLKGCYENYSMFHQDTGGILPNTALRDDWSKMYNKITATNPPWGLGLGIDPLVLPVSEHESQQNNTFAQNLVNKPPHLPSGVANCGFLEIPLVKSDKIHIQKIVKPQINIEN